MIVRAVIWGFVLWLATVAVFRFFGQDFFTLDGDVRLRAFIAAPILAMIATAIVLRLLREARGDEGEAAIGIALPVILLNAFVTHEFATALPNIPERLAGMYGAWSLLFGGSILFAGLSMSTLAPQDEQV